MRSSVLRFCHKFEKVSRLAHEWWDTSKLDKVNLASLPTLKCHKILYEAVMGSKIFRRSNSDPSLKWSFIVENLSIVGK